MLMRIEAVAVSWRDPAVTIDFAQAKIFDGRALSDIESSEVLSLRSYEQAEFSQWAARQARIGVLPRLLQREARLRRSYDKAHINNFRPSTRVRPQSRRNKAILKSGRRLVIYAAEAAILDEISDAII